MLTLAVHCLRYLRKTHTMSTKECGCVGTEVKSPAFKQKFVNCLQSGGKILLVGKNHPRKELGYRRGEGQCQKL